MARVLIVDDSPLVTKQISKLLAGHEIVATARDGATALKLYQEHHPDVVCLDVVMPGMDGLQTLRAMRAISPDARVLMISSVGGSADTVEEALRLGAIKVLVKPIDQQELDQAINEALADSE